MTMTPKKYRLLLTIIGCILCVLPPALTTLFRFPSWINSGTKETVSGLVFLLLILCSIPLLKVLKQLIKSPSSPILWLVIVGLSYVVRSIIDDVFIVACVGAIGNVCGWVIFKIRDKKYPIE